MDQSQIEGLLVSVDERDCLLRSHEIASIFKNARDWFDGAGINDKAGRMQWQLEAWSLFPSTAQSDVRRTEYIPQLGYEDGSSWPDPNKFSDDQWAYLKKRADETTNLAIRARYSDLLWLYKEDFRSGSAAIAAYSELETILWNQHESNPDYVLGPTWIVALFRPIELAMQLSRQAESSAARNQVVQRIRQVAGEKDVVINGSVEKLFSKVVDFFDVFEPDELLAVAEGLDRLLENLPDSDWFKESFLKIRLGLFRKMTVSNRVVQSTRDLVEFHLGRADQLEPESKLLAASQLAEATKYLGALPSEPQNRVRLESIQRRRTDLLSDDSQYATFTREIAIDRSHVNDYLLRYRESGAPLVFAVPAFVVSNMLTKDRVQKVLQSNKEAAPLLYAINHIPIWDDGVVEVVPETEEQLDEYHFWNTAMEALQFLSLHLPPLERALDEAWNEKAVLEALNSAQLIDPARVPYIRDGVSAYFDQSFRTAVRLLALEIEPIARGVLTKLGFAITRANPIKGLGAQRVKDLSECLKTPELCKVLDEAWVIAARALLIEDGGQKLRHRVAHGRNVENLANREVALILMGLVLWVANFYDSESRQSP